MHVWLGNQKPKQGRTTEVNPDDYPLADLQASAKAKGIDGSGTKAEIAARLSAVVEFTAMDGASETEVHFPDGTSVVEAFQTITAASGVWSYHSDSPPSWVTSDSDSLATLLADHFNCKVRSDK